MATYPGMSLKGEVRESISLDEDDLSDVEDEVFIRDGKNSYKLAEELHVKRPLMAPRRKVGKPDLTTRLRTRPPCKAFCKPCCYIFIALSVLIGLIALVVVLVSIFPLPLDKFKDWIISQSHTSSSSSSAQLQSKLLPCSNLKATDVWATKLSILTTESPIRTLDVNRDGIEDIVFGFGTGDNYGIFPEDKFCPIFLGVAPPCEGGVTALDGNTGDIIWRYWTNDTIFTVHCTADLNEDGLEDCLAVGMEGSIFALDSRNGSLIWQQNPSAMGVFVANFIPDQNSDNISDVLSSHSSLDGSEGHLVLFSGRTGQELRNIRTPNGDRTFFMPQILRNGTQNWVIFGTGSPKSPGNLSAALLDTIVNGNNLDSRTLYEDKSNGVFTQAILVDITGDAIADIIVAMYNSTVIAINGANFTQIWNYTLPNSLTNVVPTPGYFNDDNVTDFLIIYEKYDNILNYNYTKTFILDGKSGKPIYDKPISGSLTSQMGGLTLRLEGFGFDMFLFWTMECTNAEIYKNQGIPSKVQHSDLISDVCRDDFNTTSILKLNALSQYDQPPGFLIYTSVNRSSIEFDSVISPLKQIKDYYRKHPKPPIGERGQSEIGENYSVDPGINSARKHGSNIFRHKDNRQGIVKLDYRNPERVIETGDEPDYAWDPRQTYVNEIPGGIDPEFNNYIPDESDATNLFNQNQMLLNDVSNLKNSRDPRNPGKLHHREEESSKPSKKQSLPDQTNGIYNYRNIKMAHNRLLHDLNDPPTQILRDTYFKNRASQLTRSKFEQRDINSHIDKMKEKEEIEKIIEDEKKATNNSFNLWDLESEKEAQDKASRYWREKRDVNSTIYNGIKRISSVGAVIKSLNSTNNTLDIVFVTYWQPIRNPDWYKKDLADCIEEKLTNASKDKAGQTYQTNTKEEQLTLFKRECLNEQENFKRNIPYMNNLNKLSLGQMTVYRIKVECHCTKDLAKNTEKCAKFLPEDEQNWGSFLGRDGDGFFPTQN